MYALKLDVAFLGPEPDMPDLEFKRLRSEPLVVVLPTDHLLAAHKAINLHDLENETFVNVSNTAPSWSAQKLLQRGCAKESSTDERRGGIVAYSAPLEPGGLAATIK